MRNWIFYSLVVLLVLTLACAIVPMGGVSPALIAPAFVSSGIFFVLWGYYLLTANKVQWTPALVHLLVATFVVYTFLLYMFSPVRYESRREFLYVCWYALMFYALAFSMHKAAARRVVVMSLLAIAFCEVCYGLGLLAAGSDAVFNFIRPEQYHGRAGGTFVCPNHFSGFLEIILGLLIGKLLFWQASRDSKSRIESYLLLVVALAAVAGIAASLSRGGWVATAGSVCVALVLAMRAGILPGRRLIRMMALLLLVCSVLAQVPFIKTRIHETISVPKDQSSGLMLKDATLSGRTVIWKASARMFADNIFLGTGPGTWEWCHLAYRDPRLQMRPRYAHSDVLQLLCEYGLLGGNIIGAIFVCFFMRADRVYRSSSSPEKRGFALGCATAVSAMLIHSLVDFNLHIPGNALVLVALIGLTFAIEIREDDQLRRSSMHPIVQNLSGVIVLFLTLCGVVKCVTIATGYRHTQAGNVFKDNLEWNKALSAYKRAIREDSMQPEPYAKIGDIYRTQHAVLAGSRPDADVGNLPGKAVDMYRRSLMQNPMQSEVLLRLAAAYEIGGNTHAAMKTYHRALEVDPNNAFNYIRFGIFLRNIGDEVLAVEAFEKSAALSSREPIAIVNLRDLRRTDTKDRK